MPKRQPKSCYAFSGSAPDTRASTKILVSYLAAKQAAWQYSGHCAMQTENHCCRRAHSHGPRNLSKELPHTMIVLLKRHDHVVCYHRDGVCPPGSEPVDLYGQVNFEKLSLKVPSITREKRAHQSVPHESRSFQLTPGHRVPARSPSLQISGVQSLDARIRLVAASFPLMHQRSLLFIGAIAAVSRL